MKLSQLFEIFNNPVKWSWNVKSGHMWKGVFKVDEILYEFYAIENLFSVEDFWEMGFQVSDETASNLNINQQRLTATGNEFQVFSTVIAMMADFAKKNKPTEVRIHADTSEESRGTLYKRLLLRFANQHGYEFTETNVNGIHTFVVTRIKD